MIELKLQEEETPEVPETSEEEEGKGEETPAEEEPEV